MGRKYKIGLINTWIFHHVVGRASVGTYFVTFHNGQQTEAKLVYYDLYADFAILKIDPKDFPKEIEVVEFTNEIPKLGSDVFIVGNTEGQGFSFHSGYLSDLYEVSGEMPQGSYIINMNSTGGASGSPVLNTDNKAIGVLYGGGKTHSLALKGSYPKLERFWDKIQIFRRFEWFKKLYAFSSKGL